MKGHSPTHIDPARQQNRDDNYLDALLDASGSFRNGAVTVLRSSLKQGKSRTTCGEIQFAEQGWIQSGRHGRFSMWLIETAPTTISNAPWPPLDRTDAPPTTFIAAVGADFRALTEWKGSWTGFFLTFDQALLAEAIPRKFELADLSRNWVRPLYDSNEDLISSMQAIRESLRCGSSSGGEFRDSIGKALVREFLTRCSELSLDRGSPKNGLCSKDLRRVCDYIEANLTQKLCTSDIAAEIGLTPWHFSRAFKDSMGVAPYQYVVKRRIEHAKNALHRSGRISLSQLALSLGFYDQSKFCLIFKKQTGMTPKEYAKLS